ncbi:hypothetical protein J22TS1_17200 [Siminovitchia terrae]|uniref:methionyl-tRNA formyltransferase n=1 Tax=Siminovitchia terrae TaxID=1914933 RepID=UPI001B2B33B3|nr:formyltransferase family protein [Siminovitchia terrae]GIN90669.1 hypothetical protein J22TS1_17200 [Siminovitchia terrae]
MDYVVFYLLGKKGYMVLLEFIKVFGSEKIAYVVIGKDKNIQLDYYEDIKSICDDYNIKYLNRDESIETFQGYKFAIGWRWIIKDMQNLIVLHDSILPKYRGFSPLVNMLINGEKEIGVTALFATEEYDKGEIIKQEKINIEYPIKIRKAIDLISRLYARLVIDICKLIFKQKQIKGIPQQEEEASYSLWRDEYDYFIDWNISAEKIKRIVDALGYPYNGAITLLNREKIIIDEVEVYPDIKIENRDVGKLIFVDEGFPIVVCGEGLLKIKKARYINNKPVIPVKKFRSRFGGTNDVYSF